MPLWARRETADPSTGAFVRERIVGDLQTFMSDSVTTIDGGQKGAPRPDGRLRGSDAFDRGAAGLSEDAA